MENNQKLPAEFKAQWVAALRSGQYKQGRFHLIRITSEDTQYCCLGVACKVAGYVDEQIIGFDIINSVKFSNVPSILHSGAPSTIPYDLIRMNDGGGANFNEIANYIEKNL